MHTGKPDSETYITVVVTPDAKRESLTQTGDDSFEISVREPARNNLANRRVREIVARHFESPLGDVRMISGHRSHKKMFVVPNISAPTQGRDSDRSVGAKD